MSTSTRLPGVNNPEWTQAAESAKQAAASVAEMAGHAASAVGLMASQVASDVGKKADDLTARAGVGIQGLGDNLSKSAPQTGVMGSASQAVVHTVREGGQYLKEAKLSGITENVAQIIRKYPIPTILIALGLGWYIGRSLNK